MSLILRKIENRDIFTREFNDLIKNNELIFPRSEEIIIVYGPNGTGKTSLIKVLSDTKDTKVKFLLDGTEYQTGEGVFHIINDQNNRNIISGETSDFLLGANIRYEFELLNRVTEEQKHVLSAIESLIKKNFGISAGNSQLINLISKSDLADFIKDCANNKSKGNKYTIGALVEVLCKLEHHFVPTYSPDKLIFVQNDWANKQSIIKQLELLVGVEILPNANVYEIEENTEAIGILSRFHKNTCIVCDNNDIDREALLESKTARRQSTLDALGAEVKTIIERTIPLVPTMDPFGIKSCLMDAIAKGNTESLALLVKELETYKAIYSRLLENNIVDIVSESNLITNYSEYQRIIKERPDITDEDYLYIQEIISSSMGKPLTIERDTNNRLRIYLSSQEILGKDRDELPLSTGEQNFLSLTFEFLRAKNSACPIVVIDDPVSSFDSIYKNKVTYAIVKMLHNKKRIVLTHNTDLIRLLDAQYPRCFKLYLLNNTDGEENGFIPLKNNEQEMLINLRKLLDAFRESVPSHVINQELFLISMIPFMRGYANIINNSSLYESLTQVMHGYKTGKVDIARAYSELFGEHPEYLPINYEVSVTDILEKNIGSVHILDVKKFPLLNRTLCHSFEYLFLRLMVEKKLVDKFKIDVTRYEKLGQIISVAYPDEGDIKQIRNRIFLTSKKTLINEFNHFEGNLSIFQPAIDITNQALEKERRELLDFVSKL